MSAAGALFLGAQGRLRSGWRAAIFVVLLFAFCGLAQVATSTLARPPAAGSALAMTLQWIGLTVAALATHAVMLGLIDRRGWDYVGLARSQARGALVARGLALGTIPIALVSGALLGAGWLTVVPAPGAAFGEQTALLLVLFLVAALFEELVLRGYLLSALRDGMGAPAAVIATSVVFGLLHLGNPGVTALSVAVVIVAGIFLAAVRLATDSLYAAWAAHAAWNIVMALLLHTAVSGTSIAAPGGWRVTDTGPDWATGGAWGPEGGAPAAAVLLVATWYLLRRRGAPPANARIAQARGESSE